MKKKLTPKSCGHKTVPLDHFQRYKIILESVDTILYPYTNLYPTLKELRAQKLCVRKPAFQATRLRAGQGVRQSQGCELTGQCL